MKIQCKHCNCKREYILRCKECRKPVHPKPSMTSRDSELRARGARQLGNNAAVNKIIEIIGQYSKIEGLDVSTRNILLRVRSDVRQLKK